MAGLTWYDAILQTGIGIAFDDAQKGWPNHMFVWRVAQLQRPSLSNEGDALASKLAIHYALSDAVNDGSVPSVLQTMRLEFTGRKRDIHGNVYGDPAALPETVDVSERFVSAADVVAWLAIQDEAPSRFILAWLSATTAPVVSPFPLADFSALVGYRRAKKEANQAAGKPRKNIPWTDGNQLDVLRAEYERRGGGTGAATLLANSLGISRQAVEAAIAKSSAPLRSNPYSQLSKA